VGARELIVDVGMHTGRDAEFYLRKGFDVVAIEADADLARAASERLAGWVTAGQLTIREVAIAPHDGEVRFFANPGHDDWGTIREKVMRRNERQGEPSEARTVPAMRFERVLDELGRVPYYVKIDIEALTRYASTRSARASVRRPMSLSKRRSTTGRRPGGSSRPCAISATRPSRS
jgi:FkbM family methyltransferase